jgi:hypothetical protein
MPDASQSLTDHCTVDQLKALLTLALTPQPEGTPATPWAMSAAEFEARLAEAFEGAMIPGARALALVTAPDTPLAGLRSLKELAKNRAAHATGEAPRAAATLLYHAAIAAALGRHGVNISSRPAASRWALYEDLSAIFATHPFGQLFRQAADRIAAAPESGS